MNLFVSIILNHFYLYYDLFLYIYIYIYIDIRSYSVLQHYTSYTMLNYTALKFLVNTSNK